MAIFAAIKYKELDYEFESITSFKVMMDCLAVPMLYDISSDVYPHSGNLTTDDYRKPWIRGRVISTCKLFVNGCVLDDLRGTHQPVHPLLERWSGKTALMDMVPSSDPNSQEDLDQEELAVLLQESSTNLHGQEYTYQSTTDHMSQDLLLEEVVEPLAVLKRNLPTLKAHLSRLSRLPVSDPLLNTHSLSKNLILRHCAPYGGPPHKDTEDSTTSTLAYEEFHTEALLNHEALLLPVVLETLSPRRGNYHSLQSAEQLLNVAPEPVDHQVSPLDVLRQAVPQASQLALAISWLDPPEEMSPDNRMDEGPSESEGHMELSSELELDLPLTPATQEASTLLWVHNAQLPAEERSPDHRPSLLSTRGHQEMELALWTAEKNLPCVLGFLLTEPQTQGLAVQLPSLSEALKELNREPLGDVHSASVGRDLQTQNPLGDGVPGLCFSSCEFTENLIAGSCSAKEPKTEVFTALSPEHIEDILTAQEEDRIEISRLFTLKAPGVSIKEVKSNLKTPASSPPPAPPMNVDTSTCAVSQNTVAVVSRVHKSCVDATHEVSNRETPAVLPALTLSTLTAKESFLGCGTAFRDLKRPSSHVTGPASRNQSQPTLGIPSGAERAKSAQPLLGDNKRSLPAEKDPDPLSTFMMLRSQQTCADPVVPHNPCARTTGGPKVQPQPTPAQPQSHRTVEPRSWPIARTAVVTGRPVAVQPPEAESPRPAAPGPPVTQDTQKCRVVCLQATESVWRAYGELLAVARPCLSRARRLGLSSPAWGDFGSITPDQTHFLLKQQEKELLRQQGDEKELLFNQVALIHVLVTFKDMMLQCDLITAVEYLAQAVLACSGHSLGQLVRRLQVVVYLSRWNKEPNPKVLEMQDHLASWLQARTGHSSSDKVLVLTTVDDDHNRATLVQAVTQAIGGGVIAVCPEEGQPKINGARLISSVCDVACAVLCARHVGADFPWLCFGLVVEYDRVGHSPWAALCQEKNIPHLSFLTSLPQPEVPSAGLEEIVPFVVLVTDGLLNYPQLLQLLETRHNIRVLERSYPPALQLFGGTQHYTVITVDASTAIVIQEQEELVQAGYSERVVLRLTALSLQYSRCWLLLHCPDCQEGGLSGEAFSSLVLVYSTMVLFGMKSEDLDVKVLVVAEVGDVARWVSTICFHCLMSSDQEPSLCLDLHWLAVIPSEEDCSLRLFPCVNPLVSQLMLRRAPSLAWLLGSTLSELERLLPDVPHKVLKLFSDTTSLYQLSQEPSSPDRIPLPTTTQTHCRETWGPPWTSGAHNPINASPTQRQSQPRDAGSAINFLFRDQPVGTSYHERPEASSAGQDINTDYQAHERVQFGGCTYVQGAGGREEPRREDEEVAEEEEGRPFQSQAEDWIKRIRGNSGFSSFHPHTTGTSPFHPQNPTSPPFQLHYTRTSPYLRPTVASSPFRPLGTADHGSFQPAGFFSYHDGRQLQPSRRERAEVGYCVPEPRPPEEAPLWGHGVRSSSVSREAAGVSPVYGQRSWTLGLETKRSGSEAGLELTGLPPLKRGRLGFEKVPGRCDGQTRLRFL